MKRYFLFAVLSAVCPMHSLSAAEEIAVKEGKIAVYLTPIDLPYQIEFNAENLRQCLTNHLDYLLWNKGWRFCFVGEGGKYQPKELATMPEMSSYDYLLYLKTEASFHSEKVPPIMIDSHESAGTYDGLLKMRLVLSFHDLKNSGEVLFQGKFGAKSLYEWAVQPGDFIIPGDSTLPEPPDFVVKRLLSKALAFLPSYRRDRTDSGESLPVYLILDEGLDADTSRLENRSVSQAVEYASRALYRQFGFGLHICGWKNFNANKLSFSGLESYFRSFQKDEPSRGDTITLAVFVPSDPAKFYTAGKAVQIGLSDMRTQTLLIAELVPPNPMTSEWKAFLNGQLLLHEIGHLLGAVHVSDVNSIMNARTAWVSPYQFDTLNSYIVGICRKKAVRQMRVAGYLNLIAEGITNTGYRLADYPAIFFSFINLNKDRLNGVSFGPDRFNKAVKYACQGYGQYLRGNFAAAARSFYKALVCDSTQAAVQYYISKVTNGRIAAYHRRLSAQEGFYRAISESGILKD
jgi:hypothetical protein